MDIRTTVIVAVVACVLCSLSSIGLTYKYTSQHYELQIKEEQIKQATALANLNAVVITKERENANITKQLNDSAIEYKEVVAKLNADIARYKLSNGSLLVRANRCSSTTTTTNSTPISATTGASTTTGGVCELQPSFGELLSKTFSDADEMRRRLLICKSYAEAIEKQRLGMIDDDK